MNAGEYLDIAVRAWPGWADDTRSRQLTYPVTQLLCIDTETSADEYQNLLFGFARLVDVFGNEAKLKEGGEVLFYADELPETDPIGFAVLNAYLDDLGEDTRPHFITKTEFIDRWIKRYCVPRINAAGNIQGTASLVFFNAPFDLSRLADHWTSGRGKYRGTFTLYLKPEFDGREDRYMPGIKINHLSSVKAVIKFLSYLPGKNEQPIPRELFGLVMQNRVIDLHTLIFALTNRNVRLSRACELYGAEAKDQLETPWGIITPELITYARQDTGSTADLAAKVLHDFYTHQVTYENADYPLGPGKTLSPATIGKSYLRNTGIIPLHKRKGTTTDPVIMGRITSAFYGARAECNIRGIPVPVQVCDFTSQYPTVNCLMNTWDYLTAESVFIDDQTSDIQDFLNTVTLDSLLKRDTWPLMNGVAQIEPDADILPVRAEYDSTSGNYNVGINPLSAPGIRFWYSIHDLVASKLLTGKTPHIIQGYRFIPSGKKLDGLTPIRFGSDIFVDPANQNLFKVCVELRSKLKQKDHVDDCLCEPCRVRGFLKVFVNIISYGLYVEMLRKESRSHTMTLHDKDGRSFSFTSDFDEKAQEYCYPPLGVLATSAARLMLAITERLVTDAGGTWAFMDTDSCAIVATEHGALIECPGGPYLADGTLAVDSPDSPRYIRALSDTEVDTIRGKLNQLNPYEHVRELLKVEAGRITRCSCLALSAKRYTLFVYDDDEKPVVPEKIDGKTAYSEHGLGMYLNPVDIRSDDRSWIRQVWQYLINQTHGIDTQLPEWTSSIAISQVTMTSPSVLRGINDHYNAGKPYSETVKPFGFMLLKSVHEFRQAARTYIAPYSRDPSDWINDTWIDYRNPGERLSIANQPIDTFTQIIRKYSIRKDAKSVFPKCRKGLARRRHVRIDTVTHIGKEANSLDEVLNGEISVDEISEVVTNFGANEGISLVRKALNGLSTRTIAEMINTDAENIETRIMNARAACGNEARFHIDARLAGKERRAAIEKYKDEASQEQSELIRTCHGEPVRVTQQSVSYSLRNGRSSANLRNALERVAAQHASKELDIDADAIGYGPGLIHPHKVLRIWADNHTTVAVCICGCGKPVRGKSKYASDGCRVRAHRKTREIGRKAQLPQ